MTEQTKPASPTRGHSSPTPLEVARAVHRDSAGAGGRDASGPDAHSDQEAAISQDAGQNGGPSPAAHATASAASTAAATASTSTPATPAGPAGSAANGTASAVAHVAAGAGTPTTGLAGTPGAPGAPSATGAAASTTPTPAAPGKIRMTGAQALVRALEKVGADVVFGLPGGAILPAYDPLLDSTEVRHILVRHEQGAGHAATGYAQATGRVGV